MYTQHLFRWDSFSSFNGGLILQALALVHFIRRRPNTLWLSAIIFLGGVGAFVYILVEVVPDLGLLRQVYDAFGRRKRIKMLEALVLENPASGNYEELGDLYLAGRISAREGVLRQGDLAAQRAPRSDLSTRDRRNQSR